MVYADYGYYKGIYYGKAVPEADFHGLSRQASAYLDQVTFGRIRGEWEQDSRVMDACCAIVEILYRQEHGGEVASETLGRWTRNYAASGMTSTQRMHEAAVQYLGTTGLLYRGVML